MLSQSLLPHQETLFEGEQDRTQQQYSLSQFYCHFLSVKTFGQLQGFPGDYSLSQLDVKKHLS